MGSENYIFGKTAIYEAVRNKLKISKIMSTNIDNNLSKLDNSIKWEIVSNHFFKQFEDINHQFIVAVIEKEIKYLTLNELIDTLNKQSSSTILMLDEIEDPRNFGAIIRTAAAFGVDAIVYKNVKQAPINDLVIKTSMGGVYYTSFVKVSNLNHSIDLLKQHHWWIYATNLSNDAQEYHTCKFDNKTVIIIGNENHGISSLVSKNSDFNIKISMNSNIQSLNVSVAAGIILASCNLNKSK